MKNVIDLARLAKEIYRATNELLTIVVRIKSKTKKAKTINEIKSNVKIEEDKLDLAIDRINKAVDNLVYWSYEKAD